MMKRKETEVLSSFSQLAKELGENLEGGSSRRAIELSQALDRLYFSYEHDRCTDAEAESGMQEIRAALSRSSMDAFDVIASSVLTSSATQQRMRSTESAFTRLYSDSQSPWNDERVELMQSLVGEHMSLAQTPEELRFSSKLQTRLSEAIQSGVNASARAFEHTMQESKGFGQDLQSVSSEVAEKFAVRDLAVDELVQYLASEVQVSALRRNMDSLDADYSQAYVAAQKLAQLEAKLEQDRLAWQNANAQFQTEKTMEHATLLLSEAKNSLLKKERKKLQQIQNTMLETVAPIVRLPEVHAIVDAHVNEGSVLEPIRGAELLRDTITGLMHIAKEQGELAIYSELASLRENADGVSLRSAMATDIEKIDINASAPEIDHSELEFQLSARSLYQQQIMRFEQNQWQAEQSQAMLKALDFEVPTLQRRSIPRFEAQKQSSAQATDSSWKRINDELMRVHAIAQSSQSQDVGLLAPRAGASTRSVNSALQISDSAAPMASRVIDEPNSANAALSQLLASVQQLAYAPSLRSDMGFVAQRYVMDDYSATPLFKRVSYDRNSQSVRQILPSLYRVAGLRSKQSAVAGAPLRKSFAGLNLSGSNFELVKILEERFDSKRVDRGTEKVSGLAQEPSQMVKPVTSNIDRISAVASEWIEQREKTAYSADMKSLVEGGARSGAQIEDSLRAEGQSLPTTVQEKLAPFIGFDLSKVKIFSGPISEMAATAMGAHAFTLSKNIFFGAKKLDLQSPEGLGLLAHELLHTTHFESSDSVGVKESAAEAVEERVKRAFSPASRGLALEGSDKSNEKSNEGQKASAGSAVPKESVGKRPKYDLDKIVDIVTDMMTDWMTESMEREKERTGND
ncbi:MAG: DUF4157 domain-containing protein [Bradymonadales bacterium]|jgi:hypothetical protein